MIVCSYCRLRNRTREQFGLMSGFHDGEHVTHVHSHTSWYEYMMGACEMYTYVPKLWAAPCTSGRLLFVSGELLSPVKPQTTFLKRQSPSTVPPAFYQGFWAGSHSPFSLNRAPRDPAFGFHCHSLGTGVGGEEHCDLLTCRFAQLPFGRRACRWCHIL